LEQGGLRVIIKQTWIAGLALTLAAASPALAGSHRSSSHHSTSSWSDASDGDDTFSLGTLNGQYVFEASGFADDSKPGEISVLGTLTFDGNGNVTNGNLIMTHGNSVQASCSDTFDIGGTGGVPSGSGTYTFNNPGGTPGLYSMVLPIFNTSTQTGSLNFGILIPSPEGGSAKVIETDNGSLTNVQICGTPITALDLKGSLRPVHGGGGDH
jgi:hypothetical protein